MRGSYLHRMTPHGRSVAIAATRGDAEIAMSIASGLAAAGIHVVTTDQRHDAVVLLLSQASGADTHFLDRFVNQAQTQVVPVAVEQIDVSGLPPGVASLNWIWWDAAQPDVATRSLVAALGTDQRTYTASRTLEAKAWAWVSAGRGKDELLTSARQVARSAAVHAAESGRQGGESPIPSFLEASRGHARWLRWRRWRNMSVMGAVATAAAVAAAGMVGELRTLETRSTLALVANADVPVAVADLGAVKVAAYALLSEAQGKDLTGTPVAANLARLMSKPWPLARISAPDSSAVNGLAVYDEGREAWLARGDGTMQRMAVGDQSVSAQAGVGAPLYEIATSADGDVVLATGDQEAWLYRSGQVEGSYSFPSAPVDVAMSGDGRFGALAFDDRVEVLDTRSATPTTYRSTSWDSVLDVSATTSGELLALVRDGSELIVLDAVTGRPVWTSRSPEDELLSGAVGPDGSLVLSAEHQLWWSDGSGPLQGTGFPSGDITTALAVEDGVIVASSDAHGTRAYDLDLGIPIGQTCHGLGSVRDVLLLDDRVVCDGSGTFEVWAFQRPRAPGPDSEPVDPQQVDELVSRLPGGVVLTADVTAVSTRGRTVAIGTREGFVVEFDLPDEGPGVLTGQWRMSDATAVRSLVYGRPDSLTVDTDAARWTVQTCPGCGLDVTRQVAAVVARHKRCFSPDLTDLVPTDLLETLGVRLCRDTV